MRLRFGTSVTVVHGPWVDHRLREGDVERLEAKCDRGGGGLATQRGCGTFHETRSCLLQVIYERAAAKLRSGAFPMRKMKTELHPKAENCDPSQILSLSR